MEPGAPGVQRARVVGAEVLGVIHRERRRPRERRQDLADRRQLAAREDVLLDPVRRAVVLRKPLIVDGDRLQQHHAVRREQPIDGREVVVVVVEADRLEHLDADDLVELAGQLAVVGAQHLDARPGLADPRPPLADVAVLFVADRRGRHAAAVVGRRPDGEAAPAAADLEHVIAGRELSVRQMRSSFWACACSSESAADSK